MTGNDLTVVITCFNKARYIEECVLSVEEQSVRPAEIIVIDDASTDHSKRLIDGLSKHYLNVHPFYFNANKGESAARNKGLSLVGTEYVTFLNADDYYFNKDKLKNEIQLINTMGEDIVPYSVCADLAKKGRFTTTRLEKHSFYLKGNIRYALLMSEKPDHHIRDYIARTEDLRKLGGYNEERTILADYELLLKLSGMRKFYCTGQFGTGRRRSVPIAKGDDGYRENIRKEIVKNELSGKNSSKTQGDDT